MLIMLIAIGSFNLGVGILTLMRDWKRGNPHGAVSLEIAGIAASFLIVLLSAIFIRIWIRRLLAQLPPEH